MTNQTNNPFFLAQDVSEHMLMRLELMTLQPKKIAVLGEVLTHCEELLKKRYPEAEIIKNEVIVTSQDHSVDLIFANLYLSWMNDLSSLFREWRRILRPEGLILFSSFGPDTLIELREQAADYISVNLVDMHNMGDELIQARFVDPVLDVEYVTVTYRQLSKMREEMQAAGLLVSETPELILSPNEDQIFALTFEIVYGHAWGPPIGVDCVADADGVIKIPLSHLRKQ